MLTLKFLNKFGKVDGCAAFWGIITPLLLMYHKTCTFPEFLQYFKLRCFIKLKKERLKPFSILYDLQKNNPFGIIIDHIDVSCINAKNNQYPKKNCS